MAVITLAEAKKHLNIEQEFTEDDTYISNLIDVAEATVASHICRTFEELAEDNGGSLPTPVIHACLLYLGNLYQNRELVGSKTSALPFNYDYLINLYRNYEG